MAHPTLIIIDDFYENFDAVRKIALSLDYKKRTGVHYPGREGVATHVDWTPVRSMLRQFIDEPVDAPCPKNPPFAQGKFRIAMGPDQNTRLDGVHEDVQAWSAVVYLSLPSDCGGRGGLAFYRHKETGVTSSTPEWNETVFGHLKGLPYEERSARYWEYMRDESHWEEIQRIAMVGNRAVILQAQCFHASIGLFGTEPANARMTQHFEYYYPAELATEVAIPAVT